MPGCQHGRVSVGAPAGHPRLPRAAPRVVPEVAFSVAAVGGPGDARAAEGGRVIRRVGSAHDVVWASSSPPGPGCCAARGNAGARLSGVRRGPADLATRRIWRSGSPRSGYPDLSAWITGGPGRCDETPTIGSPFLAISIAGVCGPRSAVDPSVGPTRGRQDSGVTDLTGARPRRLGSARWAAGRAGLPADRESVKKFLATSWNGYVTEVRGEIRSAVVRFPLGEFHRHESAGSRMPSRTPTATWSPPTSLLWS
jgi:hypothetical protein